VAITVNYGSNPNCTGLADPNEAAAWVNYANNVQHYGIKYWTVGNEQYFPGLIAPYTADPSTYASRVASQFYPLMKAQDPTIMVGIDMAFGNQTYSASDDSWDQIVLANAKYDFVELHYYPNYDNQSNDTQTLTNAANQVEANFSSARALLAANGIANTPLYLGEFNRDSGDDDADIAGPGHETVSIVNALFTGIIIGEAAKNGVGLASIYDGLDYCWSDANSGGFPISTAYGWQTFGSWGLFAASGSGFAISCEDKGVPAQTPFPNARAYQVLSQYILAGEHTISVDSTDSSIRAYAATNKGGYVLLLINIDSTSTHTLPVTINNAAGASYTATTLTYGKQQYDQSAQGVWAGAVSGNLGTVGTTFNVSLPPWSMTLVTLQ